MTSPISALSNWNDPDPEVLDRLTHNAVFAADTVVIGMSGTGHEKTKAGVRAAIRMLLANGLVSAVPLDEWPEYIRIDVPREEKP